MKKTDLLKAKRTLRARGWSYRRAAEFLGCSYPHVSYVLNGQRQSRRLLARIAAMPESPVPHRQSGFAA